MGDRIGRLPIILFGMLSMTIAMLYLSISNSNLDMILTGLFTGLGVSLCNTGLFALTLDRVSSDEQGSATAVIQLAWDVGIVISGIGFGLIATKFGLASLFVAGAIFPLIAFIIIIILIINGRLSLKKPVYGKS